MNKKISTQLEHNKKMQEFLRESGFSYAVPMYINKGSMRGCWRIYSKSKNGDYEKWTQEAADKLNALGFSRWGKPLDRFSGNGGVFCIFVNGHNEFLKMEV